MMWKTLLVLSVLVYATQAFSRNAISLGLVSDEYPLRFWDTLANLTEVELRPGFFKFLLKLDKNRAGDEHWCCNHGRTAAPKAPVYNNRGEVVAWNRLPCPDGRVGCCAKFLEVANHCLDKTGQKHLLDALDIAKSRLGAKDTADLIALLKGGGLVG